MPQLGESVTEGTISRWLKQPGDPVERYEAIAEVVTDKVNAEIPSPTGGVMGQHLVEEGAVVPVGQPICSIDEAGAPAGGEPAQAEQAGQAAEAAAPAPGAPGAEPAAAAPAPDAPGAEPAAADSGGADRGGPEEATPAPSVRQQPRVEAAPPAAAAATQPEAETSGANGQGVHVTPAVRMLAREHDVDLRQISGTGLGGRVTKKDVLTHVQQRGPAPAPSAASPSVRSGAAPAPGTAPAAQPQPAATTPAAAPVGAQPSAEGQGQVGGDTLVPLSPARRSIAQHMVRSRQTSPHAWTLVEVDMSAVARARARSRDAFRQATGVSLTFLPFVAEAVCRALRAHPMLNASWSDEGIVLHRDINLGIAVALEDNLIVPVLRNADTLNLAGLGRGLADLTERARAGRLRIDDLQGGTFTLNNAGALGTVLSQAIINQPQAAICVMDGIVKRPVVVDDAISVRAMMNLSVSFDHRLNDGLGATRFLVDVKRRLESFDDSAPLV